VVEAETCQHQTQILHGPAREGSDLSQWVGTYTYLQELMTLTAQGQVSLHTTTYPLEAINDAMADLDAGQLQGRGILIPAGVA
jgi:NAD+-dependent secondary alcohol dehydrogenase Adh1